MRADTRRSEKYKAKLVGDVSKRRTDAYKKTQAAHFVLTTDEQVRIEREMKTMLSASVGIISLPYYIIFAKEVVQKQKNYSGQTLYDELTILDDKWTSRGLTDNILLSIKQHYIPGYAVPTPPPPVCLWLHKRKLTFTGNVSAVDLDDFPVMVHLDNTNFDFAKAQNNGEDIRFMDSDTCPSAGTPLKHEIESWDKAGEQAWLWVKVPRIDGGSVNDFIYMYYNNGAAADGQDMNGTWEANFKMVQHLQENCGALNCLIDSTSNVKHGTPYDGAVPANLWNANGKMEGCCTFDNNNDSVRFPEDVVATNSWTVEFFINPTGWSNFRFLCSKTASANDYIKIHYETGVILFYANVAGARAFNEADLNPGAPATGNWTHVALVFHDSTSAKVYFNGVLQKTDNTVTNINWVANNAVWCFASDNGTETLNGRMDEIRISSTNRSADWLLGQYNSMNDTLITYGAEEST